jgi:hypothetical protein
VEENEKAKVTRAKTSQAAEKSWKEARWQRVIADCYWMDCPSLFSSLFLGAR